MTTGETPHTRATKDPMKTTIDVSLHNVGINTLITVSVNDLFEFYKSRHADAGCGIFLMTPPIYPCVFS